MTSIHRNRATVAHSPGRSQDAAKFSVIGRVEDGDSLQLVDHLAGDLL